MSIKERKEKEKRARIETILNAAREIFSQKNYNDISLNEIAERAELGKSTLYYYFKSKEHLYAEMLALDANRLTKELKKNSSPKINLADFFKDSLEIHINYCEKNPHFLSIYLPASLGFLDYGTGSPLFKEMNVLKEHIHEVEKSIQDLTSKMAKTKGIPNQGWMDILHILKLGILCALKRGEKSKAQSSINVVYTLLQKVMKD